MVTLLDCTAYYGPTIIDNAVMGGTEYKNRADKRRGSKKRKGFAKKKKVGEEATIQEEENIELVEVVEQEGDTVCEIDFQVNDNNTNDDGAIPCSSTAIENDNCADQSLSS